MPPDNISLNKAGIIHYIIQEGWKDLTTFCTAIGLKIKP